MTTTSDMAVVRYPATGLYEYHDDLLSVYADVYADRLDNPFFSSPR